MPNIPVRQLGQVGIVKDVNPFDLPPNGFSDGINVRFDNNKLLRSPVYRVLFKQLTGTTPTGCYGVYSQNNYDSVLYGNINGRLFSVVNNSETEVTEAGYTPNSSPTPWTFTTLSQCVYANRLDKAPVYMGPTMTQFALLPGWDATWRCASLSSFKSFLFALNVTKGATTYPNLVKWSDQAPNALPPVSWDASDATRLAGETPIAALRTPIVDGGPLGDYFAIYTHDEVWLCEYVGGQFLFKFRRLPFENVGLLNQNCFVEIGGKHYCWSENDIYVHDGVSKKSIMDGRNRIAFFRDLNLSRSGVCFVAHDPYRHEIMFCGYSGVEAATVKGVTYCNYAAVYNYVSDTWSFMDVPNCTAASIANANTVWTYQFVDPGFQTQPMGTLTYDNVGGTYWDQDDSFSRYAVLTSVASPSSGLSVSKVLVLDGANFGKIALNNDTEATYSSWVQRIGIDLDELGAEIRGYKHISAMMPQVSLSVPSATATIAIGSHLTSASEVTWDAPVQFDPSTQYKIDTRRGGRYLAYQFGMPTPNDFEASGFDLDVQITGRR